MSAIWRIFARDLRNLTRNVIGVIVLIGLIVVPALYAWFNIAASWNPYGNTKDLKVAVANEDRGYSSGLMPIRINVGETVVNKLRANDSLNWQFTDSAEARDGVASGQYYAAIIIPKQFSADMMTLFSSEVTHAKLEYVINEKSNAIAPHITGQGADALTTTIDQSFAKTIGTVGLDMASSLLKYAKSPEMQQYVNAATGHVGDLAGQLNSASEQLRAYSSLLSSSQSIITSTNALLTQTGKSADGASAALKQGSDGMSAFESTLNSSGNALSAALTQADSAYGQVSTQIDSALASAGKQSSAVADQMTSLQGTVNSGAEGFGSLADDLAKQAQSTEQADLKQALQQASDRAKSAQQSLNGVADSLGAAAGSVKQNDASLQSAQQTTKQRIAEARAAVASLSSDYDDNLKPKLKKLNTSVNALIAQSTAIVGDLGDTAGGVTQLSDSLLGSIGAIRTDLDKGADALATASGKLSDFGNRLTAAYNNGNPANLDQLSSSDPDALATLLSSPVALHRVAVYPIANYGSAMTPFYTVLSIWVGSVILVAMVSVNISDRQRRAVLGLDDIGQHERDRRHGAQSKLKAHQRYFGRYLIFLVIALFQAGLVALGDLFYLGVQANHAFRFLLVAWMCALVFSAIMYTLTLSFGDVGKALCVVLLVMQVAGSGGTFPIEMLPGFFRAVYPFLPFPHAIDAMHAAMTDSYGAEYWEAMGALALFLIPTLFLGLVLRRPMVRFNAWVNRSLASTKLM
ncbi:MAG: YhgE/Pip domain-containing protein [Bifidobacterium crudilactis]|jgi:putative membrane protein|uniref:YhgE/Pip family protein n=1 Tax=Bifidobacterium crudilactis TaxID=327277 RepID=UPI003A5BD515